MSEYESEMQISKDEKEKQLSLKIEQIKIRNEELLNKKKMIEEDIRVAQKSDKVSNESDVQNTNTEKQANINNIPDETKEKCTNINNKKTQEIDGSPNDVTSQKTLENEKIDKWKKEREEVDKERVNRCQKAGNWVRKWDKFKGGIKADPNNNSTGNYDVSHNKKHNKTPPRFKSDKFLQEKNSDTFPEKKSLHAEGSPDLTAQETQRVQKSARQNQASQSKGKTDFGHCDSHKTSNARRQRYYRRNLSGAKRSGKRGTSNDGKHDPNNHPNNHSPSQNVQHNFVKNNPVKKAVKFEDEVLNKENNNGFNRRDNEFTNRNRKSDIEPNNRNDYKTDRGSYYYNNLAYPNNQNAYQQYRYYDKNYQFKQYQINQYKQQALKNSYYFKGCQYFPQQYYNYQQQYLNNIRPKNYYQQNTKHGGDLQQKQFNRFQLENNYTKAQLNATRNPYQQLKLYNSYYDQRFARTDVNQAYQQHQYRQNYMYFNQRSHNSPHQKMHQEQEVGSDGQRKSSPGSGRFVTSPWRRHRKNKKSSYSNYYSNSPRVFNAQSQQNWIVSKNLKQEASSNCEGYQRGIKKEHQDGQTGDKTLVSSSPRVTIETKSLNVEAKDTGVNDAPLKHLIEKTSGTGDDKGFEESIGGTKVVSSYSDIIIKKDAESYLSGKGMNNLNDEDNIEEVCEEKNEEYNEEDDDEEQWEDIDEIIGIQLDHGLNTYEHGDNGAYYEEEEETQVHRLNRSDESFHQFIIDNTLNIDSAQMLALNKRSTSMLMLPTSMSSLQQSLPLPGQLISQLSYPDVLDWSDNVESSAFLPSQREDAYDEDEDDDGFDEDEKTMSKDDGSDEDNNVNKVSEFSNEISKSSEDLEHQDGMKLKEVSNASDMRVDECGGGDAMVRRC